MTTMFTTILFAGALVCAAVAAVWYVAGAMQAAASINTTDALNDPLLRECRAELDDHTYVVGHTPPKSLGAR